MKSHKSFGSLLLYAENGSIDFAATDRLVAVYYNTSTSAYHVGILTAGAAGITAAATWEDLLQVDNTGLTQAHLAASISFIN